MTNTEILKRRIELYEGCVSDFQAEKDRTYLELKALMDAYDADMKMCREVIEGLERELEKSA